MCLDLRKASEKHKLLKLNDKTQRDLFLLLLVFLSLVFFLMIGADGYVMFDDSFSYINMENYVEGVMPLYPIFLRMNRILLGEDIYLYAVVAEQSVFACVCLLVFMSVVRKQFRLGYPASLCVFVLSFLPFTTDLPDAVTTQEILTEGIAYAAFYLFMAVLLKAAWKKSIWDVFLLFLITLFLSATRSQLQILFAVCGVIFFYIVLSVPGSGRMMEGIKYKLTIRIMIGVLGCLVISFTGIWCTGRVSTLYQQYRYVFMKYSYRIETQEAETELLQGEGQTTDIYAEGTEYAEKAGAGKVTDELERKTEEMDIQKLEDQDNSDQLTDADCEEAADTGRKMTALSGQYISLIFSRGMYEADYEDYRLFEDEQLQELYLYLYETADRNECLYTYASPGLWMWKDIVGGIGSVGVECFYAQNDYYDDRPEISQSNDYGAIRNTNQLIIGITLIKAHWGRLLYHTLMMLPQAFICTVFFQIAPIYLLCHIVTLFLYLSALALMIWAYTDKKVDRSYAEFMSAVLGTNLVMILIISLVFFGQQRYLVYNFGIFYVIYFLLLVQFWKIYGKNWLMKWISRRKS